MYSLEIVCLLPLTKIEPSAGVIVNLVIVWRKRAFSPFYKERGNGMLLSREFFIVKTKIHFRSVPIDP